MSEIVYSIEMQTKAKRQLKSFQKQTQDRISKAVDQLAQNPNPNNAKALKGFNGIWRLRVGDYRVIYEIKDTELVVLVVEIGHRREVYRGF